MTHHRCHQALRMGARGIAIRALAMRFATREDMGTDLLEEADKRPDLPQLVANDLRAPEKLKEAVRWEHSERGHSVATKLRGLLNARTFEPA